MGLMPEVRAAVLRAPGEPLRVEDVQLEAPHDGEVLVRVEAAGVCHTELHYMDGAIPCPLPIVLGHEGSGVVEEVGAGVDVAGQVAGKPLVVVGAGGVGLSALMGAVLVGAVPIVIDVAADKLELARRLGAADTIDASGLSPDEVVGAVQELTGGGAEVAVDAVGLPQTLRQAFAVLRPGGTAIAVGLGAVDATASIPINELVQQQKRLIGSLYGSANPPVDLPRILGLYLAGRLPLDVLLGERYALDGVDDAYDALRAGATGRAVVLPS
jgi:Zn-dependent alcohol dehydrogenase